MAAQLGNWLTVGLMRTGKAFKTKQPQQIDFFLDKLHSNFFIQELLPKKQQNNL
jgi:hypothetical protein